jgi:hypothetical protein
VLQNEGGLFKFNIALKLLSFEIDGENIFKWAYSILCF